MKKYVFAMYTSKKSKAMDELDKKKRLDDALLDQMPQDEEMIDLDTFQQATREAASNAYCIYGLWNW